MRPSRLSSLTFAVALGAGLLLGPSVGSAAAVSSGTYEKEVIISSNRERVAKKQVSLKASSCLDRYAESQARKMAKQKKMFHQDLRPILKACKLARVGENVAYGYASGKSVTAAWMKSPGHRANLLTPQHRLIGVGAYQDSNGRWYVAQVLGQARNL